MSAPGGLPVKKEIAEEASATLYSEVSRPFVRPRNGCVLAKAVDHFEDEVVNIFRY